jgi:hypothetical protein
LISYLISYQNGCDMCSDIIQTGYWYHTWYHTQYHIISHMIS